MRKGIDVSTWQGNINYDKVKADGYDFVIIRDGYSLTTDSQFLNNVKNAQKAGVSIDGVYHFSYALNKNDAIKEAQYVLENLKKAGLDNKTIVWFDFEYDSVDYAKKQGVTLTRQDCVEFTEAFCNTIKAAGYTPGVYFNHDYYKNWYTDACLDKYLKWYAFWNYTEAVNFDCDYHQYSERGQVNGINGRVDLNVCLKERDEIKMESNSSTTPSGSKSLVKSKTESNTETSAPTPSGSKSLVKSKTESNTETSTPTPSGSKPLVKSSNNAENKSAEPTSNSLTPQQIHEIATDVIAGKYGDGEEIKTNVMNAGYAYKIIMDEVNRILYGV